MTIIKTDRKQPEPTPTKVEEISTPQKPTETGGTITQKQLITTIVVVVVIIVVVVLAVYFYKKYKKSEPVNA